MIKKIPSYPRTALVLQGGGALGSYQAGVFEGLCEQGIEPNWVAGISIGSLNCAVIAGNAPKDRVEKLREFWRTICRSPAPVAEFMMDLSHMLPGGKMTQSLISNSYLEKMFGAVSAAEAVMTGQSNFFLPKPFAPGVGSPADVSFYDTSPMIKTLERFCDFDRINDSKTMRVSLGATHISTGDIVYFDNTEMKLGPEHFLASGALPPGFPAVEIDGEFYWDGGCVTNTPLEYVLTQGNDDALIFQIGLWSAAGKRPENIFEVIERQKDIQYSSKMKLVTKHLKDKMEMYRLTLEILDRIPDAIKKQDPWFTQAEEKMKQSKYNCIHLVYKNRSIEGHFKDFQFGYDAMKMHWDTGLKDILEALTSHPECLNPPASGESYVEYDFHRAMT